MKKTINNLKNKRVGFTLVELLVVIAILAVLASVSVIGYLSFVKKARVSNDTGIITQMNTTLHANEVIEGQNDTAYDAVVEIQEAGLDVNKLVPSTDGYSYAFDISQNRMFLLDESYNQIAPENLKISSTLTDIYVLVGSEEELSSLKDGYSSYLKNDFTWKDTNTSKTLTIDTGIDVGDNKDINSIDYTQNTSAQDVTIRTNSYNVALTFNAEKDTVKHYGKANKVDIESIYMDSYHEYGDVLGNINLKNGHVVVEENGVASGVVVDATADSITNGTIKISIDNKNEDKVPVIVNESTKTAIDNSSTSNINSNDNLTIKKDTDVALIDSEGFETLENAISKAKESKSATINLVKDINEPNYIIELDSSELNITINGNGFEIIAKNYNVKQGTLTLKNVGKYTSTDQNNSGVKYDSSKIGYVNIIRSYITGKRIYVWDGSLSCEYSIFDLPLQTNGSMGNSSITASECTFNREMVLAASGEYTFANNIFNCETYALYFKSGKVVINNNVFNIITAKKSSPYISCSSGSFYGMSAIVVEDKDGYKGYESCTIGINEYNYYGDAIDDYVDVIHNVTECSNKNGVVVSYGDNNIKKYDTDSWVARRSYSFKISNTNYTGFIYFATLESANNYTVEIFGSENGIASYNPTIGNVEVLNK